MIKFGPWSTILGLAAGFGALIALLLLLPSRNRIANQILAALMIVAVLRLMPYVLGFAGFYDAYPWLSFAPFDLALAIGPLVYLYVRRVLTPSLPPGWWLHLVPAALDLAYTLWAFALPLHAKLAWNDKVHEVWIDPIETVAAIVSLGVYLFATFAFIGRYRAWLTDNVSDREEHRQPWITTLLCAMALWLLVVVGFDTVDRLVGHLSYRSRFPQYLVFAAIVMGLGLEAWRHANRVFPMMAPRQAVSTPPAKDWAALGAEWAARIGREEWWREPGLSLSDVARRLATNETYVSRALNEGLGRNFNAVINGFRVEALKARLIGGDGELLGMALRVGFASKASFNRAFRDQTGMSPTAWRASQMLNPSQNAASEATSGTSAP
jgi:AraC-like DNA-binding protein